MILFKTNRIAKEWDSGLMSDKLKDIVKLLDSYMQIIYGYSITITELYRYPNEQRDYYKSNVAYKKNPFDSVHQYWRGIDIRTKDWEDHWGEEILALLNKIPYDNKHNTALIHNIGQAEHLHVQVKE